MKVAKLGRLALILSLLLALVILTPTKALAVNAPSFPSCNAPGGTLKVKYESGNFSIPGDANSHGGSDSVYIISDTALVQCFCTIENNGTQTNWWKVASLTVDQIDDLKKAGWIYIPDGSAWGLDSAPYLAFNGAFVCGRGNGGGGGGGGGNPGAPVCSDPRPGGAPTLNSVVPNGGGSVTLSWSPASGPVTYYLIAYGTSPGNYQFGVPNAGGADTRSYTINGLAPGTRYYFVVKAVNGCMPGNFSNELPIGGRGGVVLGAAAVPILTPLPSATPKPEVLGLAETGNSSQWLGTIAGSVIFMTLGVTLLRRQST